MYIRTIVCSSNRNRNGLRIRSSKFAVTNLELFLGNALNSTTYLLIELNWAIVRNKSISVDKLPEITDHSSEDMTFQHYNKLCTTCLKYLCTL